MAVSVFIFVANLKLQHDVHMQRRILQF